MAKPLGVAEKFYPGRWVVYKVVDGMLRPWNAPQNNYAESVESAERAVRLQPDDQYVVAYTAASVRADRKVDVVVETS